MGGPGVRVNAEAPGLIGTLLAAGRMADREFTARRLGATELRRVGAAEEVAGVVAWLASAAAGLVSGQTIVVDGGTLISDGSERGYAMKRAILPDQTDNGRRIVVSRNLTCAIDATALAPSLLVAVQTCDAVAPALRALSDDLNRGRVAGFSFDPVSAPLPRAPQWRDASAFLQHGRLMQDMPLPNATPGGDLEGEFGAVAGDVPGGVAAEGAGAQIRLLVTLNDWSLRGSGFLQPKPATSIAPVATTRDELGRGRSGQRARLPLRMDLNGAWFGAANGQEMQVSLGGLIADAARTRRLKAGTVSNVSPDAGSSCIAERRVFEIIAQGSPRTPFPSFGDRVRIWAELPDGSARFGHLDQRVVQGQCMSRSPGRSVYRARAGPLYSGADRRADTDNPAGPQLCSTANPRPCPADCGRPDRTGPSGAGFGRPG